MSRIPFTLTAAAALMFVLGLAGCSDANKPASTTANRMAEGEVAPGEAGHTHEDGHTHADGHTHEDGHTHAEASKEQAAIEVALAKLSPEDRKLAEAQKVCVVSDQPLGSMDVPIKVKDVKGKDVWICCAHCE